MALAGRPAGKAARRARALILDPPSPPSPAAAVTLYGIQHKGAWGIQAGWQVQAAGWLAVATGYKATAASPARHAAAITAARHRLPLITVFAFLTYGHCHCTHYTWLSHTGYTYRQ